MLHKSQQIRDVILQGEYNFLVDSYFEKVKRTPKVPTYEAFCREWDFTLAATRDSSLSPYFKFGSCVVKSYSGKILPLHFCRDEQIHDKTEIISVIHLESYSSDIMAMFLSQWSENELEEVGLVKVQKGLSNPLIHLSELDHLRRFERYSHLVSEVDTSHDLDEIIDWVQEATPMAEDYWKTQGVTSTVTPQARDLFDTFTGAGFKNFYALRVGQKDGAWGVGVFSEYIPGELYWDFSRRGLGSHIGNNILLTAIKFGISKNLNTLNLGVGYYQWKNLWATHKKWNPSIRLSLHDSNLKRHSMSSFEDYKHHLSQIKSNKERRIYERTQIHGE